jgi:hypothetical protein
MQTQPQPTARSITSSTAVDLFTVQSAEIDRYWPQVVHHIERWVAEEGIWSAEGIRLELKAARAQLWCFRKEGIRGVWVTRIDKPDGRTAGLVWGCAGDFVEHKTDALACFGVIENWLRAKGCEFVDIAGRSGWERILPDYERHAVILRKRLQ